MLSTFQDWTHLRFGGTRGDKEGVIPEVFVVPAESLGAPLKPVQNTALRQSGPGFYEGEFKPNQPGVYLVRAQSGARMVTAGLVHNPGSEVSPGTVNEKLLREVCATTGGSYLEKDAKLDFGSAKPRSYVEPWPYLVIALLLLLFLTGIAARRSEHITGLWEMVSGGGRGQGDAELKKISFWH